MFVCLSDCVFVCYRPTGRSFVQEASFIICEDVRTWELNFLFMKILIISDFIGVFRIFSIGIFFICDLEVLVFALET